MLGCSSKSDEIDIGNLPDGLKDCKAFNINPGAFSKNLTVIRCPNSTTNVIKSNGVKQAPDTAAVDSK